MISLAIFNLSVLIIYGIGRWVRNGGSCWLSSCSLSNFFSKIIGYFIRLLSRWDHPMSMIAFKFLSLLTNDFFHTRLINCTMSHISKALLSNACICLKFKRASCYMVMDILQHPFWWHLSPTCQTYVALGVTRVNTHLRFSSGVVELMYYRNGNLILLPCLSNNLKGVGPYWCRSKTLSWSKYLSTSVKISELIDPLGVIHIKHGIY